MKNFKKYIELTDILSKHKAICVEYFSWVKDFTKTMPNMALDLPTVDRKSEIIFINDKKNPIYIKLKDGSELFFTLGEFRRIKGKPVVGRNLAFSMQRLSTDNSPNASQITNCEVI